MFAASACPEKVQHPSRRRRRQCPRNGRSGPLSGAIGSLPEQQARSLTIAKGRVLLGLLLLLIATAMQADESSSQPLDQQKLGGQILSETGEALPGARVLLRALGQEEREVLSDPEGRFLFRNLPVGSYQLEVLAEGFTVERRSLQVAGASVDQASEEELVVRLVAVGMDLDEIVVSASYSLNRERPSSLAALSREQILELPTFGDDLFRAINLVPGTGGNDLSSAFTVRGAPYGESLVQLDGVELFEPFHLKDFAGALSIVDPRLVDGIEIFPGVAPARYGGRQASVVDLTTRRPDATQTRTGISLSSVYLSRGAVFGSKDQGAGLLSLRRGWLDIVFNLVGPDEEEEEEGAPEYTDAYAKLDWDPDSRTNLGLWALFADDRLDSSELEDDGTRESIDSSYGNLWMVARGQRLWDRGLGGRGTVGQARLFAGRVDRDRRAAEDEGESDFEVRDERQLDVLGLRSELDWEIGDRHLLSTGFELRSYTSDYDYLALRDFSDPIGGVAEREDLLRFAGEVTGEAYGVWLSDRWRLNPRLVAELGLRYDRQTWFTEDEDQVSPRASLVWDLGEAGILRAGWGLAHQPQRPNELAVQDGDLLFYGAERSEHRTLGWERPLGRGLSLRVDAYQRLGRDLRPRYVNLFSPVVLFPEGTPDRVRLDVDRSEARGVELFLQGRRGPRFGWWLSYAWSEIEDRVDGVWVPREIDQTHALTLDLSLRLGRRWRLNSAWIYHTGWPTTAVSAELVAGDQGGLQIAPILGPLYGERVADYHRLDLRLSRDFQLRKGQLELYFDVQNLYNRENERGFEFGEAAFQVQADGSVRVLPEVDTWLGAVPSFGVSWDF